MTSRNTFGIGLSFSFQSLKYIIYANTIAPCFLRLRVKTTGIWLFSAKENFLNSQRFSDFSLNTFETEKNPILLISGSYTPCTGDKNASTCCLSPASLDKSRATADSPAAHGKLMIHHGKYMLLEITEMLFLRQFHCVDVHGSKQHWDNCFSDRILQSTICAADSSKTVAFSGSQHLAFLTEIATEMFVCGL